MKKLLLFAGLSAATLSFVGCNKEADVAGLDGRKVQIILSDAQTRTVNDGLSTKWAEGDALNVFFAPAGTTEYSSNVKFEVTDVEANTATGTAELTADANDWYALYPYASQIETPANTSKGYVAVGSRSNATQTQSGLNSTAHLAGSNLPVWGMAKNVAIENVPDIAMKQVCAVVKVNVKNALDKAITISSVSFTGTEDIVGTYYIDFSGDALAFTASGTNYVSSVANLTVSDAAALASGETASFYLAVKPFTAPANSELGISITSDAGIFETTKALSASTEFAAGHIKGLNVSFSSADTKGTLEDPYTASEAFAAAGELTSSEQIAGVYVKGIVSKVTEVSTSFGNATYNISDDGTMESDQVVIYRGKYLENASFTSTDQLKVGDIVVIYGTLVNYNGTTPEMNSGNYLVSLERDETKPSFGVSSTTFSVSAETTSVEVGVTGNVDWTAVPGDNVTVDPVSGNGEGTVTVTFPANTDAENTKEYSVHFTTEASGVDDDDIEVIITQEAAPSEKTIAQVLSLGAGTYDLKNLLVYSVVGNNVILGDSTGKMLMYLKDHGLSEGDNVSISSATVVLYNDTYLDITGGTITKNSTGNSVNHGTAVDLDDATAAASLLETFSADGYHSAAYVSISGVQSGRNIANDNATLYMNAANTTFNGKNVIAAGYVFYYNSSYKNYNFQLVSIEDNAEVASLEVDPSSLSWKAGEYGADNAKSITVTLNGSASGYSVSGSSSDWTVSDDAAGTVTVYPNAANGSTADVKTLTLTITHKDDASVSNTVTCTQGVAGAVEVSDVLTADDFAATNTTYTDFSGVTKDSGAIYAGQSAKNSEGAIQLRSKNSNSGIVSTTSGGKVKSITIEVASGTNTIDVYGSNTAYTSASDLYSTSGNTNQGTKLGSLTATGTVTVDGDYEYVGIRSNSGAIYISKVTIVWE